MENSLYIVAASRVETMRGFVNTGIDIDRNKRSHKHY